MLDICDDYGFRFIDNVVDAPVCLVSIGTQARNTKKYYWDCNNRQKSFIFQYTLSGSGTLKINSKTYILSEKVAFFIETPSDSIYCFDEATNEAPWEFLFITINGIGAKQYFDYITSYLGNVFYLSKYHPAIRKLVDIYSRAQKGQIINAFVADMLAFEFLCLLCDTSKTSTTKLVDNAKEYMENNFNKPISILDVAQNSGVSQSHLSREFFKYTHEQPIKYLTKIRLEKAIEMLCRTDASLEHISNTCGFNNENYFCKVFKKYINSSPSEFRKQILHQNYTNIKL